MIALLFFLAVPAAEIYLFIEIGGRIGAWPTIAIIFGTALLGGAILRYQGRQMIMRAREQVAKRGLPVAEIADGAILVLAALLLLTPGFITDALGALLLVPFLRRLVLGALLLALRARIRGASQRAGPGSAAAGGPIIEGKFEDVSNAEVPDEPSRRPPSRHERSDRD